MKSLTLRIHCINKLTYSSAIHYITVTQYAAKFIYASSVI